MKCTDLWSWRSTRTCEWKEVPRPRSTVRQGKPCPVPHCHAQQASHHAPLSDSKPRPTSHCQQTSPCAPLLDTANLALRTPHCQQTLPCAPLSDIAKLAPRLTVRHSKPRPVPHCQQTLPHVPLSDTANLAPRPTFRHSKSCLCLCFYTHNICTVPLQQYLLL